MKTTGIEAAVLRIELRWPVGILASKARGDPDDGQAELASRLQALHVIPAESCEAYASSAPTAPLAAGILSAGGLGPKAMCEALAAHLKAVVEVAAALPADA